MSSASQDPKRPPPLPPGRPLFRIVGSGPFRLPWEHRRQQRAYDEAKEMLDGCE